MQGLVAMWLLGCVPTYSELPDTGEVVESPSTPPGVEFVSETASGGPSDAVFRVFDAEQPASTLYVTLTSSVDGVLHEGNPDGEGEVVATDLSDGEHLLLLTVEDAAGLTDQLDVLYTVVGANRAPDCTIFSPTDGDEFTQGEPVFMSGGGEDPDGDDLTFLWESSAFGPLAFAEEFEGNLPLGEQDLTLTVTDSSGESCVASVTVTVVEPAP